MDIVDTEYQPMFLLTSSVIEEPQNKRVNPLLPVATAYSPKGC